MAEQNDQPVPNLTASEHEPDATLGNQTVANVVSTRSPLGLLDLPPEVRVLIFHHLLVNPQGIKFRMVPLQAALGAQSPLAIFRTSRLMHEEALKVFYGENHFVNFLGFMPMSFLLDPLYVRFPFPRIVATIQNIHVEVYLATEWYRRIAIQKFLRFMPNLGTPSVLRGTLVVDFSSQLPLCRPVPALSEMVSPRAGSVHQLQDRGADLSLR